MLRIVIREHKSKFQLAIGDFSNTFVMSVIEKITEFLNTLMMKCELRYKCWIKHCCHGFVCGSLSLLNILFSEYIIIWSLLKKLSCAAEILI